MLPDRVALGARHHLLDKHQELFLDNFQLAFKGAILAFTLCEQVLQDLPPIVPNCREIWGKLRELFSLAEADLVVDFVIALLEHLRVDRLDFYKFFVALLDFFRCQFSDLLLFPPVKHFFSIDVNNYDIL